MVYVLIARCSIVSNGFQIVAAFSSISYSHHNLYKSEVFKSISLNHSLSLGFMSADCLRNLFSLINSFRNLSLKIYGFGVSMFWFVRICCKAKIMWVLSSWEFSMETVFDSKVCWELLVCEQCCLNRFQTML